MFINSEINYLQRDYNTLLLNIFYVYNLNYYILITCPVLSNILNGFIIPTWS